MFTGIVEHVGTVVSVSPRGKVVQFALDCGPIVEGVPLGDSIAINGTDLTVTVMAGTTLRFEMVPETASITKLGLLRPGSRVNLERALSADGRLGGHFVQGHIDCTSRVVSFEKNGDDHRLEVELPGEFAHYVAYKGSIALNGISLTIAEFLPKSFAVWIIPHTKHHTNIDRMKPGDWVNIEFDILAKYVERMLARYAPQD